MTKFRFYDFIGIKPRYIATVLIIIYVATYFLYMYVCLFGAIYAGVYIATKFQGKLSRDASSIYLPVLMLMTC